MNSFIEKHLYEEFIHSDYFWLLQENRDVIHSFRSHSIHVLVSIWEDLFVSITLQEADPNTLKQYVAHYNNSLRNKSRISSMAKKSTNEAHTSHVSSHAGQSETESGDFTNTDDSLLKPEQRKSQLKSSVYSTARNPESVADKENNDNNSETSSMSKKFTSQSSMSRSEKKSRDDDKTVSKSNNKSSESDPLSDNSVASKNKAATGGGAEPKKSPADRKKPVEVKKSIDSKKSEAKKPAPDSAAKKEEPKKTPK